MAAMVACSLPTLMFPTLSLYISEVWSSGWCPFPLTVRESWIPLADLEYWRWCHHSYCCGCGSRAEGVDRDAGGRCELGPSERGR